MLSKLLPVLLILVGTGAGIGAGLALREPAQPDDPHMEKTAEKPPEEDHEPEEATHEYVKLNNQFVVPIVEHERVAALVVLSLSLETKVGLKEAIFEREPKLRDAFLQVLFGHANMGGFNGAFTNAQTLDVLRGALRDVAVGELGDGVSNVLITDIARQDV